MFKVKNSRLCMIILIFICGIYITETYAAGMDYSNDSLDDLNSYIDYDNLNIKSYDIDQQVLENQYDDLIRQIQENLKQNALIQNQIDRMDYKKGLYEEKREQMKLVEKYQLQTEYYNVCLLLKQLILSQSELDVANKNVIITEEKFILGDATLLEADDAKNKKKQVEDYITSLNLNINQKKNSLKARLNVRSDVQFNPDFSIPISIENKVDYLLDDLKMRCLSQNLNIRQAEAYIGYHDKLVTSLSTCVGINDIAYKTALAEYTKMQVDEEILIQQLDQYIEKHYYNLKISNMNYTTMIERKPILQKQLEVLDNKYSGGIISEINYLSTKYIVFKELYNVDKAIVENLNALSLVDLINKGITL